MYRKYILQYILERKNNMKETSVFQNGASQAIRISKDMRVQPGCKIYIEKIDNITIIIEGHDPWASVRVAQALANGQFMPEGRSVNPIADRDNLD